MDTVVVFTRKDLDVMFAQGGCGDWVANGERLNQCTYLIAVANARADQSRHPVEKHSHAFLIGKIYGTKDAPENSGRKIILLGEYAEIDIPNFWTGQQNPVRYTNLSELEIDPERVEWKPFPLRLYNGKSQPKEIEKEVMQIHPKQQVTSESIKIRA
jgi:hypothetical protein